MAQNEPNLNDLTDEPNLTGVTCEDCKAQEAEMIYGNMPVCSYCAGERNLHDRMFEQGIRTS